jgi:acyl dehydratase
MSPRYAHELQAGEAYEGYAFTATPELNQQFLYAVEDYNRLYLDAQEGQPPLVHPVLLMHMTPRTRSPSFAQAPGMGSALARDQATWLRPARVGEQLRVDWMVNRTYEQRGRIYQDYVATVRNESGEVVFRRETSATFFTLALRSQP